MVTACKLVYNMYKLNVKGKILVQELSERLNVWHGWDKIENTKPV